MTNQSKFFTNLGNASPISMIYLLRQSTVILSDPRLINHLFKTNSTKLDPIINDRANTAIKNSNMGDSSGTGDWNPFAMLKYHQWLPRRKLIRNALPKVLNSKYLDNIVLSLFKQRLIPKIKKNTNNFDKNWNTISNDFASFQFYILFESIFGDSIKDIDDTLLDKYCEFMKQHTKDSFKLGAPALLLQFLGYKPSFLLSYFEKKFDQILNHEIGPMMYEIINNYTKFNVNQLKSDEKIDFNHIKQDVFVLDTMVQAKMDPTKCMC